jgi:hypothetical protein
MKEFKVMIGPGLILVMSLALFAQEPQGRGGQDIPPVPGGAPAPRGGQVAPNGAAPARGAQGAPGGAPGGQRGGGGGGGGGERGAGRGGRNLQVLNQATLPETMQSFVQALGLLEKGTCAYCHVEDRSSDEKRPKQVARRMITMVRAINGTFGDGQQHVNCYTCHRGSTTPLMEPPL